MWELSIDFVSIYSFTYYKYNNFQLVSNDMFQSTYLQQQQKVKLWRKEVREVPFFFFLNPTPRYIRKQYKYCFHLCKFFFIYIYNNIFCGKRGLKLVEGATYVKVMWKYRVKLARWGNFWVLSFEQSSHLHGD